MIQKRHPLVGLALALIVLFLPETVCAQIMLKAQGTAKIESYNTTAAEKTALQDAYNKAILIEVMRGAPSGYSYAIAKTLPAFLASRGMQDITQYQVTSRSQQDDILLITAEFKIKENFLQDWLYYRDYMVPVCARPKIMLAISSNLPGEGEHEWWSLKGKKGYSIVETIIANNLSLWGENITEQASLPNVTTSDENLLALAGSQNVQFLLRGTLSSTTPVPGITQYELSLALIDVARNAATGTWALTYKGDLPAETMLEAMFDKLSKDIRAKIARRIDKTPPPISQVSVCIDNITRFSDYQKMLEALTGTEGVEDIQIATIAGHSICHNLKYRGNIERLMQSFKAKIPVNIDIVIRDDTVHLSLTN